MPTYPTTSPSGRAFDIDAASEDEAKQVAAQRFFQGLEPPEAPQQSKPTIASFFSQFQNDLAKQIAAKRTGYPYAAPTAADYYHVANSQAQNETEYAAYEQQQREMLIKRQREQARLNSIWEDDMPRPPLEDDPLLQASEGVVSPQQQQGPWSITNRMTAASALRGSRYRRALAALTSRNPRYPR